ncbi:MAG: hypothetical protein LBM93_07965 [Oscillospiraceae bacterium]|jgi:superfamily I DNA/RNA helicase|nr:hypothetical protein [Oscillospiraceae bacterium]
MADMLDRLAKYRNNTLPTEPVKNAEELAKFFDKKTPEGYYMHSLHRLGFKVIEEINGEWSLTEFAKMLWKKVQSVEDLVLMLEDFCEQSEGRVGGKSKKITIATVHEFKGKERDSVYIWQDTFGYFPASKADVFIPAEIEEERRVHYIACTRARQKCTIYALNNLHGMFLNEMDCAVTDPNEIKGELNIGRVTKNESDNAIMPTNEIKGELNCGRVNPSEVKDLAVG